MVTPQKVDSNTDQNVAPAALPPDVRKGSAFPKARIEVFEAAP
jgi:hypothetical protein